MKKYVIQSTLGITNINQINIFKRYTDGVTINTTNVQLPTWDITRDFSEFAYTEILYRGNSLPTYTAKKIEVLPESTESNTIVTNDGLIGVLYTVNSVYYLAVLDLYDVGEVNYEDVKPIDGSILTNYVLGINPEHRKMFSVYKSGSNDFFKTQNQEVYKDSTDTYFRSNIDYDLETDDYGFFKIPTVDFVSETEVFSFYKKQFLFFQGPSDLEIYELIGSNYVLKEPITSGGSIYWFSDLDVDTDSKFVRLKFKSATSNYSNIIVY
jgi:hypothetical protein